MKNQFPIVAETKILVKKEDELSAQILRNLQIIYDQKIHLEMGYSGIFKFCMEELGMCAATAQRRSDALKISQFVPDLPSKIEKGEITLSRVAQVAKFVRTESKETGRTFAKKEVEQLVNQVQSKASDYESQKHLMTQSQLPVTPIADQRKVVSGGRTVMLFEVDDEFQQLLELVKDLESHKGSRKMGELLKDVFKEHLQRKHPAFKNLKKSEVTVQTTLNLKAERLSRETRSRHIPARIRKEIWRRDQSCTYVDSFAQKRCGSTFRIQLEHLTPFSLGGGHTLENITLRCQSHNLFAAEKMGLLNLRKMEDVPPN